MKKYAFLLLFLFVFVSQANAKHEFLEKDYQKIWCEKVKGTTEYILSDKSRVDCVTNDYVIEFKFAPGFWGAVGQIMYYSTVLKKKAAIVLIIEKDSDIRFLNKLFVVGTKLNIEIFVMKKEDIK